MEASAPTLIPLLVNGIGRDGTTLFMQLLGTSPQIVFDRTYPYERRYFSYLLEWSRLLDRVEWDETLWHKDSLANPPEPHGLVGPIPWLDRSLIEPQGHEHSLSLDCFRLVWREFSRRVAAAGSSTSDSGDVKPAIYYAEKHLPFRGQGLKDVIPHRVLPLVRDPRDVWLSIMAFERRRGGYLNRALVPGETEAEFMLRFADAQRDRMRWLAGLVQAGEVPVFRYEDLVTDLPGQAERVQDALGVRLDPEVVVSQRDDHAHHMTATTPEESVERWRSEMSEADQQVFLDRLAPELGALGYETR